MLPMAFKSTGGGWSGGGVRDREGDLRGDRLRNLEFDRIVPPGSDTARPWVGARLSDRPRVGPSSG